MSATLCLAEECAPTEKARRSLERLSELFGGESLPPGLAALAGCESAVADAAANLARVFEADTVLARAKWLVAVGVAAAVGSREALALYGACARRAGATAQNVLDAVGVANTIATFNGFFRFRELARESQPENTPPPRAAFNGNVFMKSSLAPDLVEMICIAVSSLNACGYCVGAHIKKARLLGVMEPQIEEVVKTGAVTAALARTMGALG